ECSVVAHGKAHAHQPSTKRGCLHFLERQLGEALGVAQCKQRVSEAFLNEQLRGRHARSELVPPADLDLAQLWMIERLPIDVAAPRAELIVPVADVLFAQSRRTVHLMAGTPPQLVGEHETAQPEVPEVDLGTKCLVQAVVRLQVAVAGYDPLASLAQ